MVIWLKRYAQHTIVDQFPEVWNYKSKLYNSKILYIIENVTIRQYFS